MRHLQMATTISKKRNASLLILAIFSVQLTISSVVYNFSLLSDVPLIWSAIYHAFSLVCTIPQAGFSDIYGRKRGC